MGIDRESEILDLLREKTRVSVAELADRFGVSEVTARKDLARLETLGHAVRTRGGAVLSSVVAVERPIDARRNDRTAAKEAIARCASALIQDGDTIFVDSGTTAAALASLLRGHRLRVVTHSLLVLELLQDDDELSLYTLGGLFNREARSFVGPSTTDDLVRYSFDAVFVGASGMTSRGTCSAQNVLEADIKRQAFATGRRRVVMADSSKFDARAFAVFAGPKDFDTLITDDEASPSNLSSLRELGLEVLIANAALGGDRAVR